MFRPVITFDAFPDEWGPARFECAIGGTWNRACVGTSAPIERTLIEFLNYKYCNIWDEVVSITTNATKGVHLGVGKIVEFPYTFHAHFLQDRILHSVEFWIEHDKFILSGIISDHYPVEVGFSPRLTELVSMRPNGDEILFLEETVLVGYKRMPNETPTTLYPPNDLLSFL